MNSQTSPAPKNSISGGRHETSMSRAGIRSTSAVEVVSVEAVPFIIHLAATPRACLFVFARLLRRLRRFRRSRSRLVYARTDFLLSRVDVLVILDRRAHRFADRQAHKAFSRIGPAVLVEGGVGLKVFREVLAALFGAV